MPSINSETCTHCFIDVDINHHRSKLALAAAFVDATDSRYGFSSKDLRCLGGSEISRIEESIAMDHEWSGRNTECGGVEVRSTAYGSRVVVRLLWDVAPIACENFATLCVNGGNSLGLADTGGGKKSKPPPVGESGKPLTYRESKVHRVVPGFIVQGGDFVFGNGSGGESITGKNFKDERAGLALKHDRKGIVSMGNSGKNSNTSQFFITFDKAPQCDGKHVVFGEVISGFEVLDAIEKVGTAGGEPSVPVTITECGAFRPLRCPGAGYWYDQPDAESFTGVSPTFVVRPRVAVVAPAPVVEKFQKAMGAHVAPVLVPLEKDSNEGDVVGRAKSLLETFSVDLIVVAPACAELMSTVELPASWGERFETDEVIITAKPVEVLSTIWSTSWIGKHASWQLDGASAQ